MRVSNSDQASLWNNVPASVFVRSAIACSMSATIPATWFWALSSAARTRSDCGKIEVKRQSNEKNTLVAMQARNMTHSIEFRIRTRAPWM